MPNDKKTEEANTKVIARILAKQNKPNEHVVPGWNGYNQKVCNIGSTTDSSWPNAYDEFSTIWTVMQNCKAMTEKLGQKYTVITYDEQLYCKAKMLQWDKPDICQGFVIMLGGFHTQLNFCKVLGERFIRSTSYLDRKWCPR